jgi:hypothetical protein
MESHSEVARLLRSGRSALDETVAPVSEADLTAAEVQLSHSLPPSYREFVTLGGLAELRFKHRILAPNEILEAVKYIDGARYIPFADNGCGDLYCWEKAMTQEPRVIFVDHETEEHTVDSDSFLEWLRKNRF